VRSLRHAKSIGQKAARVLSLASLLKNPLLALTRLFKCLKVFFERLADPLEQSPVFFPFLSRESAVRSVQVHQKFLLRKFHSLFRPPQVFQRFWGWHVALFGHYVCVTTELALIVSLCPASARRFMGLRGAVDSTLNGQQLSRRDARYAVRFIHPPSET